jgi:hypothetical protein
VAAALKSFARSSLELAWRGISIERSSLFVWTCLASAAFATYPNESCTIDLTYGDASANVAARNRDRAPNETFNFERSSFIVNARIPGGPVRENSAVAQADEWIAGRRANLLPDIDLVGEKGLEEGTLYAYRPSVLPPIKRNAREFLVFNDIEISSIPFDLWLKGIQEPPRNVGDTATQCCGGGRLLSDVIEVPSPSPSEGKELVPSNPQYLAGSETAPATDAVQRGCPLGPLGVSRDEKRITYALDHDLSGVKGSATTDNEEPKYIKITALDQAIGGWFEKDTHASVFQLPQADIDVSFDGKTWFHAFGPRCVKNEPRFRETKGSN